MLLLGVPVVSALMFSGCGSTVREVSTSLQKGMEARQAYQAGHERFAAGKYKDAIPHFLRTLSLEPDFDEAEADLAWSFYHTGRYEDAIRHFRQALRRQPRWEGLHNGLGWALYEQRRYPEAADAFRESLSLDPRHRDAAVGLAYALFDARKYADALPLLERLTREGEGHMLQSATSDVESVRSRLAWTFYYLRKYDRAREEFQKGISARPDWYGLHNGLGWTQLQQGDRAAARQSFERALRLKPDLVDARQGLARAR